MSIPAARQTSQWLLYYVDDREWRARLEQDQARADHNQTAAQRDITRELLERARDLGAEAFALTGSTARGQRTKISDLDYHVIGVRPNYADLHEEIDIVASDALAFEEKLRAGDDYVQWTLRFGCILLDRTGVFRDGIRLVANEQLRLSSSRKRERLPAHRTHAERLIALGDRDAAQEQLRATLTAAARVVLIEAGAFPLSRRELPGQLEAIGWTGLADGLRAAIHRRPSLGELTRDLRLVDQVVHARDGHVRDGEGGHEGLLEYTESKYLAIDG